MEWEGERMNDYRSRREKSGGGSGRRTMKEVVWIETVLVNEGTSFHERGIHFLTKVPNTTKEVLGERRNRKEEKRANRDGIDDDGAETSTAVRVVKSSNQNLRNEEPNRVEGEGQVSLEQATQVATNVDAKNSYYIFLPQHHHRTKKEGVQ